MKSLKDFKAAFKLGDAWACFNSDGWAGTPDKEVVRVVGLVQSNAVAFKSSDPNRPNMSWLYWPKASEVSFINNPKDGKDNWSIRLENPVTGGYLIYRKV